MRVIEVKQRQKASFMRLSSDFWVSAFMRDVRAQGGFAYLQRRGAEEAGAVFIKQNGSDAFSTLFGPAAQSFYDETNERGDRLFMVLCADTEENITARLYQELEFDPDIWIIEVENLENLSRIGQFRLIAETKRNADSGAAKQNERL